MGGMEQGRGGGPVRGRFEGMRRDPRITGNDGSVNHHSSLINDLTCYTTRHDHMHCYPRCSALPLMSKCNRPWSS